jgi:hypothetical protein
MSDRIAYPTVGADTYKGLLGVHQHLARVFHDARLHANEVRLLGEPYRRHCDYQSLERFERRLPQSTGGKKIDPVVLRCECIGWSISKQ